MRFQRQKKDLFNCMFLLVNFIKIIVFICKQALEKLKCFFWRRIIIIFHKCWLKCLYSLRLHSLWPFVFCPSFISNNLNNVTSPSSNQRFWPDSRLILHRHYGIFCLWVAEVPPHETSPCNGKGPGKMAVFRGYTEQNFSQIHVPGTCLGEDWRFWNWLIYLPVS